ncbi:MAG: alpha/beta fold hydrolase [Nitrososphaerota archaeon]|nr:alpha/beta fold hydrolase [Nitrososphaerota archaeon]MDG6978682.1 alpha/beta fold hydrolase [Nitrososphaerota archaeon]MDG7021648.1 alpha/beta fold hydrolase [Nitrososphaerota archaeon]
MTAGLAQADGVELYFERRGNGPPLLLIPGGGGDCGFYTALGEVLSRSYTVIAYDRRGNSRSRLRGAPRKITVAQQAEDALAVLRANGFASAAVFGSSGGATIALEMAARHPHAADAVVPHEPATPKVLPDGGAVLAEFDEVERVLADEGWEEAFKLFAKVNRLVKPGDGKALDAVLRPDGAVPRGPLRDLLERQSRNWEYMLRYEVRPFVEYPPDLERIRSNAVPLALLSGAKTRGQYFHRASEVIAERLGVGHVEFPGGHSGALESPVPFGLKLEALLGRLRA